MNMFVQPNFLYRLLVPGAVWRVNSPGARRVYLTFDDGPVPEVTPAVLDILKRYGVKATFFMVGDNVRRHPELLPMVVRDGHSVGNHTMHHLQGIKTSTKKYLEDVEEAAQYIPGSLFRPPHGLLRLRQLRRVSRNFRVVMHDLVTYDFSKRLTSEEVLGNVKKYTRPGSIIVFHDSLKAMPRVVEALPKAIEWLISQDYEFDTLPME